MDPCKQEEVIRELKNSSFSSVERLTEMEKRQIAIAGDIKLQGADISHIKGRIDNGLSATVTDMHRNLTILIPVIDRHTALEKRIEDWFWSCVKGLSWTIFGGLVVLGVWAVGLGWKPFH